MQLTKQTDYSMRILMYLGINAHRLCTIREVCGVYKLSTGHTMKLVHELGRAGFVKTTRGRNGGITLGIEPKDINVGEVVRFTEKNMALVECFRPDGNSCPLSQFCVLELALQRALNSFMAVLDEYSLQDLIRVKGKMKKAFATVGNEYVVVVDASD